MLIDSNGGARVYTPIALKLYDWWVLSISNTYTWRCSTVPVLLEHSQQYLVENKMDIGDGTGYYLSRSRIKPESVTLVDLNPNSLKAASGHIAHNQILQCIQHDIYMPLPVTLNNVYDSISMFYLLHGLPGNMASKQIAVANAAKALKSGVTFYGATILDWGVTHNKFGSRLTKIYNNKGIFNNLQDSVNDLSAILNTHFQEADVKVCGTVALFSATRKIH